MSYADLYERVQAQTPKIRTNWLRSQVIDITDIQDVKEQWTGAISAANLRGFWVEGPLKPPVSLTEKEGLIVLSRDLTRDWRRLVLTKELMHAFDTGEEKADTPEKLEQQAERLCNPAAPPSAMFRAEHKAHWRALAALCPEDFRQTAKDRIEQKLDSMDVVATRLQIPVKYIPALLRDDFLEIVEVIKI